jgi:hypothetical protein
MGTQCAASVIGGALGSFNQQCGDSSRCVSTGKHTHGLRELHAAADCPWQVSASRIKQPFHHFQCSVSCTADCMVSRRDTAACYGQSCAGWICFGCMDGKSCVPVEEAYCNGMHALKGAASWLHTPAVPTKWGTRDGVWSPAVWLRHLYTHVKVSSDSGGEMPHPWTRLVHVDVACSGQEACCIPHLHGLCSGCGLRCGGV